MKYCKNGDVRFNLLIKGKSKTAQIWLIFNFDGNRLRYYTGKRIESSKWDDGKQLAKPQYTGASVLNDYLKKLSGFIVDTYTKAKYLDNKPTVEYLKEKLSNIDRPITETSFFDYFEKFIAESKTEKSPNTIKKYNNALAHLKKFAEEKKLTLEFSNIDMKFYEAYKSYLITDVKLTNNTVAKLFKVLKVFLKYSTDSGVNTKLDYHKFKASEVDGEVVFLSWKELMLLYNYKLENGSLAKVRDVFCFECFTGLRYSDVQNLKKNSVVGDFLHVNIIKKREKKIITIPLIPYAKNIIKKYSDESTDKLLPCISNQKMNDYLKEIGEMAKINEPVIIIQYQGSNRIESVMPKYEVLTTHIGRKTFITNALERGVQPEVIMSITDHATHKAFKRYYKIVDDHKKREIIKAFRNLSK
jgi:site-specific recombinase XerD